MPETHDGNETPTVAHTADRTTGAGPVRQRDVSMMRAVVLSDMEEGLVELGHVPVPSIDADELLVRVRAVGVGIHDSYFLPPGISVPFPIGIEAAGVIEQVGHDLTERYQSGDRIAFISTNQLKGGTWAEYAVVRGDSLILPIPDDLSFEKAAAIPVAGNTVLRAFHALPPIPKGGSLFVAGASGAIGTFAVQLGSNRGWQVAGSASPHNHDYLTSLGASMCVDYHDPTWPEQIRRWMPDGVDGALAVQPSTTIPSIDVVKDGGTVVTVSGDQAGTPPRGVAVTGLAYEIAVHQDLLELIAHITDGHLQLEIEQIYPFDEALAALSKVQTRHARGKIVLSLPEHAPGASSGVS